MASEDSPGWLTREQQAIWRAYLDGVARINEAINTDLRSFGLDMSEYEILVRLSEAECRVMRMSDLAEAARQSRSRLTHTVGRMERKGLLVRKPCPNDGRGVLAVLTDAGYDLLVTAAPSHVAGVRAVFVDAVDPADYEAVGRAMAAVVRVGH